MCPSLKLNTVLLPACADTAFMNAFNSPMAALRLPLASLSDTFCSAARMEVGALLDVTARSVFSSCCAAPPADRTVVVTPAVLLPATGSDTALDTLMVFINEAATLDVAVMTIVAEAPAASDPRLHEIVLVPAQAPCDAVTVPNVDPPITPVSSVAGSTSVATTDVAASGPAFAIVTV